MATVVQAERRASQAVGCAAIGGSRLRHRLQCLELEAGSEGQRSEERGRLIPVKVLADVATCAAPAVCV
jgi:hypothetical protein